MSKKKRKQRTTLTGWLYKQVFRLVVFVSLVVGVTVYAKGSVADAITFLADTFPQQRSAPYMPSEGCMPNKAKDIRLYGLKFQNQDEPDWECNYREAARTFYELGMFDHARFAACMSGTAEDMFGNSRICEGFDSSKTVETQEYATAQRQERGLCSKSKPKWYHPLKRRKYKDRCV